jgi:hypothetical protein
MAYTINKTDGTVFASVADGTVDTSSSVTIIGKNYAGYGEFLGENFIKMLENSAKSTAPSSPLTGQLWFDTGNTLLKVYSGTQWKNLGAATSDTSAPSLPVGGDLWFDETNNQLNVYDGDGASWIVVGPAYTAGTGTSGAIVDTVTDTGATDHVVVKLYVDDTIVSIISKDATFTPASSITGFATIKPGVQLSTTVSNALFQGTSTDAQLLDGIDSTGFLSATSNDTTTGTLGVLNDTGFKVGADNDFQVSVSGSDVTVKNATSDGDINLGVNDGGVAKTVITLDGATANLLPGVSSTTNIGASGNTFGTVYATTFSGTASQAQYADLAERFEADAEYEAGTVVSLGGVAEVTQAVEELSEDVFGVVSNRAAYLMNATAGSDATHPPIAMNGRVPVKVVGTVNKGDRLVSAGNGFARAAKNGEATARNIIGRALQTKTTEEAGTVEAVVKINF